MKKLLAVSIAAVFMLAACEDKTEDLEPATQLKKIDIEGTNFIRSIKTTPKEYPIKPAADSLDITPHCADDVVQTINVAWDEDSKTIESGDSVTISGLVEKVMTPVSVTVSEDGKADITYTLNITRKAAGGTPTTISIAGVDATQITLTLSAGAWEENDLTTVGSDIIDWFTFNPAVTDPDTISATSEITDGDPKQITVTFEDSSSADKYSGNVRINTAERININNTLTADTASIASAGIPDTSINIDLTATP